MNFKKTSRLRTIISNKYAVIGLPLRLVVSIIIGVAVLSFVIPFILNPCLFPSKMIVTIEPMINIIPSGFDEYDFSISVKVTDREGHFIKNANVLIKGLGDATSNLTDSNGKAILQIKPKLEKGVNEGYLDIVIKAGCMEKFSEENMIKIIRGNK